MKKFNILMVLLLLAAGFTFTSCSDDDEWNTTGDGKVEMQSSARAFVLNEGSMNKNNSNIFYFDWSTFTLGTGDLYAAQNGKKLGDTGNDILATDGKLLVAVNVSNYIALLDGYGVEKSRVSFEQYKNLGQVRNIEVDGNTVYATSYGGYVSRLTISGNTLTYKDSLRVGDRPEDIALAGGKAYVTLQGANWTDNRVAVVGSNFKVEKYIEVMQDPVNIYTYGSQLFVQGFGAMYNNPWGVIDANSGSYTELGNATKIGVGESLLYVADSETNWSTYETSTTLFTYNPQTKQQNKTFFKNAPAELASATVYSISVNPYDKNIFLATSDYMTDGKIYVFDQEGNYLRQFTSGGLNPNKIAFLK